MKKPMSKKRKFELVEMREYRKMSDGELQLSFKALLLEVERRDRSRNGYNPARDLSMLPDLRSDEAN